jgi:hypothetical protein
MNVRASCSSSSQTKSYFLGRLEERSRTVGIGGKYGCRIQERYLVYARRGRRPKRRVLCRGGPGRCSVRIWGVRRRQLQLSLGPHKVGPVLRTERPAGALFCEVDLSLRRSVTCYHCITVRVLIWIENEVGSFKSFSTMPAWKREVLDAFQFLGIDLDTTHSDAAKAYKIQAMRRVQPL